MADTGALIVRQSHCSRAHHGSISVNEIDPDDNTLKHITRMSKIGGFYDASIVYRIILGLYMICLISSSIMIYRESVCIWLNIYVTLCQIDGFICYIFGIIQIDKTFIFQLSKHISYLDHYHQDSQNQIKKNSKYIFSQFITGQSLLKREILVITLLFLLSYSSALVIVFDTPWNAQSLNDKDSIYVIFASVTDIFDVLRYMPSAMLILLTRLYFETFSSELTAFRQRHDILTRFEKLDDEQVEQSVVRRNLSNASNISNIQNDPNTNIANIPVIVENKEQIIDYDDMKSNITGKGSMGNQLESIDFGANYSPYIVRLNMSHYDFKNELETIIFPYRNTCRNLRIFFMSYLTLNSLCFIFVLITTIKGFIGNECDADNVYYLHYVTEMSVYFLGWVLLMIPLAENHRKLRSLNRDIKSKVVFKTATEQILIHQYLDSVVNASPFAVGYIIPTYSKLGLVFYVLFSIVGGQLLSFFVYNSNK